MQVVVRQPDTEDDTFPKRNNHIPDFAYYIIYILMNSFIRRHNLEFINIRCLECSIRCQRSSNYSSCNRGSVSMNNHFSALIPRMCLCELLQLLLEPRVVIGVVRLRLDASQNRVHFLQLKPLEMFSFFLDDLPPLHRVTDVLHHRVGASRELIRDLRPRCAVQRALLRQDFLLCLRPRSVVDSRIEATPGGVGESGTSRGDEGTNC